MQAVSAGYAPYTDVRYVGIKITFGLVDTDAAETGVPELPTGAQIPPSQPDQVQSGGDMTYGIASAEKNQWILDGGAKIMPENLDGVHTGYWSSALSDGNAEFTVPQQLGYSFPQPVSCAGFTLSFDDKSPWNFASKIKIETKDSSGAVVTSAVYDNDKVKFTASQPTERFTELNITFLNTWLPCRRVRLAGILFGIIQEYGPDNLESASWIEEISPDMSAFPAGKFEFTFDNRDRAYDIANPKGIYRFLQDDQKISASLSINGESVEMCSALFETSKVSGDGLTATITSGDFVSALDGISYNGGASGTWTFLEAVTAIKAASGLSFDIDIPQDIGARTVGKAIPANTKCREALRLAAQAAKTTLRFDRTLTLTARDIDMTAPGDGINGGNAESLSGISDTGRINTVYLVVKDSFSDAETTYTAQNLEEGESVRAKTVNNPCASDGQGVAQWLLAAAQDRVKYTIPARGNPALDTLDVLTISDIYGGTEKAYITKIATAYNGGLSQDITAAVREAVQ